MELTQPRIADLVREKSPVLSALLEKELDKIAQSNFRLKSNYSNLRLDKFYAFTLLLDEDRLVAFSGLQKPGPWDASVARIGSRYYVADDYRTVGMLAYKFAAGYQSSYHTGSKFLNPYQMRVAREIGLSGVFFSRENLNKRRNLRLIAERCTFFEPSGATYEVLPDAYNVCQPIADQSHGNLNECVSCWQNIVAVKLSDNFRLGLPRRPISSYSTLQKSASP